MRFAPEGAINFVVLTLVSEAARKFDPWIMREAYSEVYDMALRQRLAS